MCYAKVIQKKEESEEKKNIYKNGHKSVRDI
jgi:hypothetical protein